MAEHAGFISQRAAGALSAPVCAGSGSMCGQYFQGEAGWRSKSVRSTPSNAYILNIHLLRNSAPTQPENSSEHRTAELWVTDSDTQDFICALCPVLPLSISFRTRLLYFTRIHAKKPEQTIRKSRRVDSLSTPIHGSNLARKSTLQLRPLQLEGRRHEIIVSRESFRKQVELLDNLKAFHSTGTTRLFQADLHLLLHSLISTELLHTKPNNQPLEGDLVD